MKKRRKYAKHPMLYIEQPKFGKPTANMQSAYKTPRKTKEKPKVQEPDKKVKKVAETSPQQSHANKPVETKQPKQEHQVVKKVIKEEARDQKELNNDKESKNMNQRTKRKRFAEMTIKEKVDYFVGLPIHVPKMKCEVRTADERLRGVIVDCKDDLVYMVTTKRKRIEVNIEEIEHIRLIGL